MLPAVTCLVWIDTTELFKSYRLNANSWPEIRARATTGDVLVAVAEVSVREAERQFTTYVHKAVDDMRNTRAALAQFLDEGGDEVEAGHAVEQQGLDHAVAYAGWLRAELESSSIVVHPLPSGGHQSLLDRDLENRLPFRAGKGYRDSLIWESLLELLGHSEDVDEVVFVSGNLKDFCESDSHLLPELIDELLTIRPGLRVTYRGSLKAAAEYLRPKLDGGELEEAVPPTLESGEEVLDAIYSSAADLTGTVAPTSYMAEVCQLLSLDPEVVGDGYITSLDPRGLIEESWVIDVRDDGTTLTTVNVAVDVDVEFYIHKSDFDEDADYYILNSNWNDHMMLVLTSQEAVASFNVESTTESVLSAELDSLELA